MNEKIQAILVFNFYFISSTFILPFMYVWLLKTHLYFS